MWFGMGWDGLKNHLNEMGSASTDCLRICVQCWDGQMGLELTYAKKHKDNACLAISLIIDVDSRYGNL